MSGCIREEDNNGGNYSYCIGSHRLSSGINGRFAQWFSLHTHSTTAKIKITSLNSHFPKIYSGTRCRDRSTLRRFWQLTPTNRTHFLSWLDQWGELALRAFDRVDFYSFDCVRV
jgi:hypothetical protein